MSEQIESDNANDRIDLLQLRVKDLEELQKTNTDVNKIMIDSIKTLQNDVNKITNILNMQNKIFKKIT